MEAPASLSGFPEAVDPRRPSRTMGPAAFPGHYQTMSDGRLRQCLRIESMIV